ncbi:hypothetical protein X777_01631 [Ooceraea biroi]|uniref:Secreted protein n=1 Tax=Ooceraea biroi TaxID=2015173 RepID=A0A026WLV2_OOCBI|nr:hypothetical protein X777_01631 [Ooceraea biroi]
MTTIVTAILLLILVNSAQSRRNAPATCQSRLLTMRSPERNKPCSSEVPRLDLDTASSDKEAPKRLCQHQSWLHYV